MVYISDQGNKTHNLNHLGIPNWIPSHQLSDQKERRKKGRQIIIITEKIKTEIKKANLY